jgi:predicted O-methyltransferase YrrM
LEIGFSLGVTTKHLLSNLPNLKLYGIDPYISYVDWNGGSDTNEEHENYLEIFIESIEPYKNRHYLYRDLSDNVMDEFEDDSLDFIFIDGLHTYEQCRKDVVNSLKFSKVGSWIALHDLLPNNWVEQHVPPVRTGGAWTGDVWKVAFELLETEGILFKILELDHGVGVFKVLSPNVMLKDRFIELSNQNYSYFHSHHKILPIIGYKEFQSLL